VRKKPVPKMALADVEYVLKELEAWRAGQRGSRLVWELLEKASGFSRQALSAKTEISEAFAETKLALKGGVKPKPPRESDFLENRIASLDAEVKRYQALEAVWLERFARYAYHCRGEGISVDKLDRPIPVADRK